MRYLLLIIPLLFSSCAYNAYKDPVYQSYLRGEIPYSAYVDHYNSMTARRQAFGNALTQASTDMRRQQERQEYLNATRAQTNAINNLATSNNLNSYRSLSGTHCTTRESGGNIYTDCY